MWQLCDNCVTTAPTSARSVSRGCAGDLGAVVIVLPGPGPHPQLEAGRAQVGGAAALAPAEHAQALVLAPARGPAAVMERNVGASPANRETVSPADIRESLVYL